MVLFSFFYKFLSFYCIKCLNTNRFYSNNSQGSLFKSFFFVRVIDRKATDLNTPFGRSNSPVLFSYFYVSDLYFRIHYCLESASAFLPFWPEDFKSTSLNKLFHLGSCTKMSLREGWVDYYCRFRMILFW